MLEDLRWLGLDWDEGPFFQMQRLARYREVAEQMVGAKSKRDLKASFDKSVA